MSIVENTLVVVPARGGSKRIPNKNIRLIAGKPMIGWPLSALTEVFPLERILLSTDSDDIKAVAKRFGVTAPFTRPEHLANDFAATMEVVSHALDWHEQNVAPVEYVLVVYPTAVLIDAEDIFRAIEKLETDPSVSIVFSATEYAYPIQRAIFLNENGKVQMFQPEHYSSRSQDLTKAYHDAGQFYYCRSEVVRRGERLISENAGIVELPRWRVVDIDTEDDLKLAEIVLNGTKLLASGETVVGDGAPSA